MRQMTRQIEESKLKDWLKVKRWQEISVSPHSPTVFGYFVQEGQLSESEQNDGGRESARCS